MSPLKYLWKSAIPLFRTSANPVFYNPLSIRFCFTDIFSHPDLYEQLFCILKNPSLLDLKRIHTLIIVHQFLSKSVLVCRLLSGYSSLSNIVDAQKLFDSLPNQTVHTYNHMIKAYIDHQSYKLPLVLYFQLLSSRCIVPNHLTFSFLIQASTALRVAQLAKVIHGHILVVGLEPDLQLMTSLMDYYNKSGCLDNARALFNQVTKPDVFVWTVMINGYLRNDRYLEASELFSKMKESGITVGIVTWNALLAGLVHGGLMREALNEFQQMQLDGVMPDKVTLCIILPALGQFAILKSCLEAHAYVIRIGLQFDLFVVSALVDLYAKCGNLASARYLFDAVQVRDTGLWNTMIFAYGAHGHCYEAFHLFDQMQASAVLPNAITFTSLLSACSHAGMVSEGRNFFDSMFNDFGLVPGNEHYTCMVDMYGRAGMLEKAYEFIRSLPMEPSRDAWGAFLGSCRTHHSLTLAKVAGEQILKDNVTSEEAGYHVVMSNIYAETGQWAEVAKVRTTIRKEGLKKRTAFSWIEIGGLVHVFYTADMSHPQSEVIHSLLNSFVDVELFF